MKVDVDEMKGVEEEVVETATTSGAGEPTRAAIVELDFGMSSRLKKRKRVTNVAGDRIPEGCEVRQWVWAV
jgi:hypothetical protein